jgi:hypothetical protein
MEFNKNCKKRKGKKKPERERAGDHEEAVSIEEESPALEEE